MTLGDEESSCYHSAITNQEVEMETPSEVVPDVSVITLRVTPELHEQCREAAEDADLSLNRWIIGVLRDEMDRRRDRELLGRRIEHRVRGEQEDGTPSWPKARELVAEAATEYGKISAGFDAEMRVRFQVPNVGDDAALAMSLALHKTFGAEILRWNPAARIKIDGPYLRGELPIEVSDHSEMDHSSGLISESRSGMGEGWGNAPGWYED